MLLPPCFTVGMVPVFLYTWCLAYKPRSSILVSSDQRILFLIVLESLRFPLANSKGAVMYLLLRSGFHLATTINAWLLECCRYGCPSGRFSHLHRGTLEHCQGDHRVLGHLPDHGPSPLIVQFGRVASSRKSPNFSHLRMMEATVFLKTFNAV